MRAKNAVEHSAHWAGNDPRMQWFARFGMAARGVVFLLVGVLAVQVALGRGGETTGASGAFLRLAELPFGAVLLGIIAVGMVGLVAWRFAQAIGNIDGERNDKKGYAKRLGRAGSGFIYATLCVAAVKAALGRAAASEAERTREWTAQLMSLPFGRVLVLAVGVAVLAYGGRELWAAAKSKLSRKLQLNGEAARHARTLTLICRVGIAARGMVFALMGGFLAQAAIRFDPDEARGLGATLADLSQRPYGAILLGAVALGLVAFAVYCFIRARYDRVGSQPPPGPGLPSAVTR